MSDEPRDKSLGPGAEFIQQVGLKPAPRPKAQGSITRTVWFGLGMMGLVGWSVAMPTLVAVGLGLWLDANDPVGHSWLLIVVPIGLALGCFNAWRWVSRERQQIREGEERDHP